MNDHQVLPYCVHETLMWNCVAALFETQVDSVNAVSLVNKFRPMFHIQKKMGDTRSVTSKTVLVI